MRDIKRHESRLDPAQKPHDHLGVDMPHVPQSKKTAAARIALFRHAKPNAQRQPGMIFHPTAQPRTVRQPDTQRSDCA